VSGLPSDWSAADCSSRHPPALTVRLARVDFACESADFLCSPRVATSVMHSDMRSCAPSSHTLPESVTAHGRHTVVVAGR